MATMPATTAPLSLTEWVRDAARDPHRRLLLAGIVGCLALWVAIFRTTLRYYIYVWSTDENYSHGFLVPLISLYFANEALKRGPVRVRHGIGLGAGLLALALLAHFATILVPVGMVEGAALLLGLAGVCALLLGVEGLRRFGFALGFLAFMIPLPVALYTLIASPLQLLVSQAASALLNVLGIPVLCQGNMMTLPGDVRMFVAEACSGLRQLTGFLALTTAVAYLSSRPLWYRGLLIASSIPIALTANLIRVVLTGVIMYSGKAEYASGSFHTLEGLLMMGLGLWMLSVECWVLNHIGELVRPRPRPVSAVA